MSDLARILALPRRTTPPAGTETLAELLGPLRPVQAQALAEGWLCRGLLAPISVGGGKTLVTFLLPRLLQSHRPVLLVPAALREKTRRDWADYSARGWRVSPVEIVSYELLGREQSANLLDRLQPDLIMANEAHRLKNRRAACTRRVARWMREHPDTPFAALSGTLISRSVRETSHLALWALGDRSPLPTTWSLLQELADATDADGWVSPSPRILQALGPNIRESIRRRILETPGVVASHPRDGCAAGLRLVDWECALPDTIRIALAELRDTWATPNGDLITRAVDLWRHARDIAQGFFYRWVPPPPPQWLDARAAWKRFVRETLKYSRTLDSEAQVARAHAKNRDLAAWRAVRDTYVPDTVPEWLDHSVVREAAAWARNTGGIVWVDRRAVGDALERHGVPYYGRRGEREGQHIEDASGPIAASVAANSTGRNLQRWRDALVLAPPSSGARWEQMLGRLHREGQKADTVRFFVHLASIEHMAAFEKALDDAVYQQNILGKEQKILLADVED